jgi:ADP-ribosylglycohydrolase
MGNGSAMRVAPLGAYFADDTAVLVEQARLSAQVTHLHCEGEAGAIAVALAAAFAASHRGQHNPALIRDFFEFILQHTPAGVTRDGIAQAMDLPRSSDIREAMALLGNGSRVTCPDTVPLCLWMAARHFNDYRQALWMTAAASGDIDTNCAIVGGIVSLSEADPIPARWLAARGRLHI